MTFADDGNQQQGDERKTLFQEKVLDVEAIKREKFKIP